MTGEPAAKKQRTEAEYDLIYWPGVRPNLPARDLERLRSCVPMQIPGRGEPIRLMFEEAGVAYTDTSQQKKGVEAVLEHISPSFTTGEPLFAILVLGDGTEGTQGMATYLRWPLRSSDTAIS